MEKAEIWRYEGFKTGWEEGVRGTPNKAKTTPNLPLAPNKAMTQRISDFIQKTSVFFQGSLVNSGD